MTKPVSKFYGGFKFIDPNASRVEVANELLPTGQEVIGTAFPCRITVERKRVLNRDTGKRHTRDWLVGHFVMWDDGKDEAVMGREEICAILRDAKACNCDEIVVFGQIALIASPKITFRQFGVRDLSLVPDDMTA